MLNALIIILVGIILLIAVLLVRTLRFSPRIEAVEPLEAQRVDTQVVADHLSKAVRCQTISFGEGAQPDAEVFLAFHHLLEEQYPRVHAALKREVINRYSLLYTWEGHTPSLPPALLAGHIDVVPVAEDAQDQWRHLPFGGEQAEGYVWGRGTLDDKHQVITILEAVEALLTAGYQPARTILLAFGHDEEVGGRTGAGQIVTALQERGIRLAAAIDEGGSLLENILPGIKGAVALIGTAEKGYLTLELETTAQPGHSSTPPEHTAIGILAQAITRLENTRMPARLTAYRQMFQGIGGAAPFYLRLVFANLWLLGGLIERRLRKTPMTNAAVRTTSAVTLVSGGIKDNILPSQARAGVNFRLLPGDSIAKTVERAKKAIRDPRVKLTVGEGRAWEASKLSPVKTPAYRILERTIRQVFGMLPVAPYLVLGATDARYYASLCDQVYRFTPCIIGAHDMPRVHGHNERISIDSLGKMVQFYDQLIRCWGENGL